MKIKNALISCVLVTAFIAIEGSFSYSIEENNTRETEEFDFANGLFSRGMYDMAIGAYEDFAKKYPESSFSELANYQRAECYFLSADYIKARESFAAFSSKYPASKYLVRTRLREGQIYYLKGEYAPAQKILADVVQGDNGEDKESPWIAKYYLANIRFSQGDYDAAKNMLEGLLSEDAGGEHKPFAYMNLGDIYTKLEKYTEAAGAYEKAASLSKNKKTSLQGTFSAGGAYYLAGDHLKAQEFYRKVIVASEDPKMLDNSIIGLLSALRESGKNKQIIEESKKLLTLVDSNEARSQVLFMMASGYFNENQFREAAKAYAETAKMYPKTKFGLKSKLNECWALYRSGQIEKCLSNIDVYVSRAIELLDEALYIRAKAFVAAGKVANATQAYKDLINNFKRSDFHREALYEIGWLYSQEGDPVSAISYFEMFAKKYPEDERSPEVLLKAAQENVKRGSLEGAEDNFNSFLIKHGSDPLAENVLYQLGGVYLERGSFGKAVETYEKFLKKFPTSKAVDSAVFNMGQAYQKQEKWSRAVEVYSALTQASESAFYGTAMEASAYCKFQQEDYDAASNMYFDLVIKKTGFTLPEGVYKWTAAYYIEKGENNRSLKMLEILSVKYPENSLAGEVSFMFAENYAAIDNESKAI